MEGVELMIFASESQDQNNSNYLKTQRYNRLAGGGNTRIASRASRFDDEHSEIGGLSPPRASRRHTWRRGVRWVAVQATERPQKPVARVSEVHAKGCTDALLSLLRCTTEDPVQALWRGAAFAYSSNATGIISLTLHRSSFKATK